MILSGVQCCFLEVKSGVGVKYKHSSRRRRTSFCFYADSQEVQTEKSWVLPKMACS